MLYLVRPRTSNRLFPALLAGAASLLLLANLTACDGALSSARIQSNDPELQASATRMLRDLERISGLKARAPIRVARQEENQLRESIYAFVNESREQFANELEAYVILGLAPPTFDAFEAVNASAREIAGYYDYHTKQLYVLTNVPHEEVEIVLAHELVHAIQDQHIDLGMKFDEVDNDRSLAFQAAIEGHASMAMAAWMIEQMTGARVDPAAMPSVADQLRRAPIMAGFTMQNSPRALQRMFYFPYIEGSSFVRTLWKRYPDRLALALDSLRPASTEQVLNPERSLLGLRDEPLTVEFEPPPTGLATLFETVMGEFAIRLALEESLGSRAATAANGWKGDRLRLLHDGGTVRVLQWLTAWDDATRADTFEAVARRFVETRAPTWQGAVTRRTAGEAPFVLVELANTPAWFRVMRETARD